MKLSRITGFVAVLLLVIASLVVPAGAQDSGVEVLSAGSVADSTGPMVDETPQSYFVELQSLPAVEGTSVNTLRQEKANFRAAAGKAGVKFQEKFAYDQLFNGLSVRVSPADLPALARMPEVKAIWPVIAIAAPQAVPGVSDPDMFTAINMTGASYAQTELGYTGKGVKVGVIDTGIDYKHPDLGGCFGPNCKVAVGFDFVGDAYNADPAAASYNPIPAPDADPMDCAGHGSHVTGIIGANGVVKGVAPDVTFGAYRVFGCEGSTESDIMLQAMEKAQADGMQIINMSIGSAYQWPQYPTAVAATRMVNKGIVVVASIGNDGAKGLWSNGAPGVGDKVIGVAAFENTHMFLPQFTATPDNMAFGYVNATAAPIAPLSGSYELARTGNQTKADDGCYALPAGSLAGKVALIRRGTCGFYNKALNAQLAGAAGVVLYNNQAGSVNPTVAGAVPITIPVVMISQTQGNLLDSRLAAGPVTMTWTDTQGSYPNSLAGRLSDFTSYGMTPDLTLKPDIAGPGGNIYSTYPLAKGGYATLSGTSMSSPHVAGTVALLLQAKPHTPAQAVRSLLQNTAEPKNWSGNPGLGYLDFTFRQGAGMVQIDKAILATANVVPGKLSLGESQEGPAVRTLTVTNTGTQPVTYTLSHTPSLSVGPNPWLAPSVMTGFAGATFSAPTVTVPAGGTAQVIVTITANATLPDGSMYGGYIVFDPGLNGQKLRVPYAGFKGDYQALKAMTPVAPYNFPWLSNLSGGSYHRLADGAVFTMQNGDIPYAVIHFEHAARRIRIDVKDAVSGKDWHVAAQEEYIPMNSTNTGIFAWAFDGTTTAGNKTYTVPNGKYYLVVSVEKALGSDSNPADWETWTSPTFEIARP